MARPLRIQYPWAFYYVTSWGNRQKEFFLDEEDRRLKQQKLAASVARCQVRLYTYVFMRNQLHLLIKPPRANLSRFMQHFNTAYTVYFNRRHRRHEHLLEGRFQARILESSRYALSLTRSAAVSRHLQALEAERLKNVSLTRLFDKALVSSNEGLVSNGD
jgi:putative transposase